MGNRGREVGTLIWGLLAQSLGASFTLSAHRHIFKQVRKTELLTDKPVCEADRLRGHPGLVACHLWGNDDCLAHVGCDGFGET